MKWVRDEDFTQGVKKGGGGGGGGGGAAWIWGEGSAGSPITASSCTTHLPSKPAMDLSQRRRSTENADLDNGSWSCRLSVPGQESLDASAAARHKATQATPSLISPSLPGCQRAQVAMCKQVPGQQHVPLFPRQFDQNKA